MLEDNVRRSDCFAPNTWFDMGVPKIGVSSLSFSWKLGKQRLLHGYDYSTFTAHLSEESNWLAWFFYLAGNSTPAHHSSWYPRHFLFISRWSWTCKRHTIEERFCSRRDFLLIFKYSYHCSLDLLFRGSPLLLTKPLHTPLIMRITMEESCPPLLGHLLRY